MPKAVKLSSEMIGTTIDIKDEKVLSINDVIFDFDAIFNMLINDELEPITHWNGIINPTDGSQYINNNYFIENMYYENGELNRNFIDWYLTDDNLVIIAKYVYYYEFALDIESNKNLFKPEFLEKMDIK